MFHGLRDVGFTPPARCAEVVKGRVELSGLFGGNVRCGLWDWSTGVRDARPTAGLFHVMIAALFCFFSSDGVAR